MDVCISGALLKIRKRKRKRDGYQLESGVGWDRIVEGACRYFSPPSGSLLIVGNLSHLISSEVVKDAGPMVWMSVYLGLFLDRAWEETWMVL